MGARSYCLLDQLSQRNVHKAVSETNSFAPVLFLFGTASREFWVCLLEKPFSMNSSKKIKL